MSTLAFDPVGNNYIPAGERLQQFTANLVHVAGTYDIATVGTDYVMILGIAFYNSTAAAGLTSVSIQTNDTVPVTLLASTALAALGGNRNLAAYVPTGALIIPATKKIQLTVVGTGTAGAIECFVRYLAAGSGVLS